MKKLTERCFFCNIEEGTIEVSNYQGKQVKICQSCNKTYCVKNKLEKGLPIKKEKRKETAKYYYTTGYCIYCKKDTEMKIYKHSDKYQCTECKN